MGNMGPGMATSLAERARGCFGFLVCPGKRLVNKGYILTTLLLFGSIGILYLSQKSAVMQLLCHSRCIVCLDVQYCSPFHSLPIYPMTQEAEFLANVALSPLAGNKHVKV